MLGIHCGPSATTVYTVTTVYYTVTTVYYTVTTVYYTVTTVYYTVTTVYYTATTVYSHSVHCDYSGKSVALQCVPIMQITTVLPLI
jgi:hypothetical protein